MKLLRLYLKEYRVLKDLEIRFHPSITSDDNSTSYSLDFLVGLNGSGKSTALQAIVDIFLSLERNASVPFPFELAYELGRAEQKRNISLTNRLEEEQIDAARKGVKITVNEKEAPLSSEILPSSIVAFTSGNEAQWMSLGRPEFEQTSDLSSLGDVTLVEKAISELPGVISPQKDPEHEPESEKARFCLSQNFQLPIITLCGLIEYLSEEGDYPTRSRMQPILKRSGVSKFCGFSLRFRLNEGIIAANEREDVHRMSRFASRALHIGSDRLLVFDLTKEGADTAKRILEEFGGAFQLFQVLSGMRPQPNSAESPLQEVNIFLERENDDNGSKQPLHLFDWLSDGEQSFLGRMCLFNILRQEDTLILLDEPEVHFNDYWKRQIVYMLDGVLQGRNSHVLISTHSSITLTDVPREDIILLERSGAYTQSSKMPRVPTLAADPSDIMVHVFSAPYATGQRAVEHIRSALEPIIPPERRKRELEKLLKQVGPGYWSYRIRRALKTAEATL
ncbi:MAG: AAA family ATPase [Candidatus Thorarchaeota archaeon]